MKNVLIAAGFLALITDVARAESPVPVLNDDCRVSIKIPDEVGGRHFMSEDCSTVFIAPGWSSMEATNVIVDPSVDKRLAKEINDIFKTSEKLTNSYLKIQDEIFSLVFDHDHDPEGATVSKLKERGEALLEERKRVWSKYEALSGQPGALVNFRLSLDLEKKVEAVKKANKGTGLKFRPVSIIESEVIFKNRPDTKTHPVLSLEFPGFDDGVTNSFVVNPSQLEAGIPGVATFSSTQICYEIEKLSHVLFKPELYTPKTAKLGWVSAMINYKFMVKDGDQLVERTRSAIGTDYR